MKTKIITLCVLLAAWSARADLTATVTPGYVFATGERPTTSTLNLLANPSITISGTIGGTNSGLAAKSVNGTMFADNVVDNVTIQFDGSAPRALEVKDAGIGVDQISSTIAGNGLGGGSGAALSNKVDGITITITNDTLTLQTNLNPIYLNVASNSVVVGSTNDDAMAMTPLQFATNVFPGLTFTSATTALNGLTAGNSLTAAHNLGVTPKFVAGVIVCTSTELNYAVGDEVPFYGVVNGSTLAPAFVVTANSTNVFVVQNAASGPSTLAVMNKSSGVNAFLDQTKWSLRIYARP